MIFVNVVFRSLVIVVGLFILFGIKPFDAIGSPLHEIFGIVVVLFGIYRVLMYSSSLRRKNQ